MIIVSISVKITSVVDRVHLKLLYTPTIDNEAIASHLEALLTPAIFAQPKYYKQLGLLDRILNLSLMVAAVLTLQSLPNIASCQNQ